MHDETHSNSPDASSPHDAAAHRLKLPEWMDRPSADPSGLSQLDREQRFDARVAEVLHDVPLPEGLAERIMARLAVEDAPTVAGRPTAESVTALAGRRWRLAPGWLATAAALLLIALAGYQFAVRPSWTLPQVLEQTVAYHELNARELRDALPAAFPFSNAIRRPANVVGRRVAGLLGHEGSAYDIRRGKVRATLYVLRLRMAGVPTSPPARPDTMTGGRSVAAWQENDLLYVLVVEGGPSEYRIVSQRVVT